MGVKRGVPFGFGSAGRAEADVFFEDLIGSAPSVESWGPISSFEELVGDGAIRFDPPRARRPAPREPAGPAETAVPVEEAVPMEGAVPAETSADAAETFGSDSVRVSLRNDDGTPAAGVQYRVTFRNGEVESGTLDGNGEATVPDRAFGDFTVTFPGLPAASWQVASFGGS
jgi:hypothetical protein